MTNGTFTYGTTPNEVITAALKGERYSMELVGRDTAVMTAVVNQGIDSHLEGITESKFHSQGKRLICDVSAKDMLIVLRRLGEMDDENAMSLRSSILTTLDIEEI